MDQIPDEQCVLVIVGADEYGRKGLLAMTDGFRESTQSWREVLLDLKRRGLKQDPKLAIGDGALVRPFSRTDRVHPLTLGRPARGLRHGAATALPGPQEHERPEWLS